MGRGREVEPEGWSPLEGKKTGEKEKRSEKISKMCPNP